MDEAAVEEIHSHHPPGGVPVNDCSHCHRERATCRKKYRFQTGDEASKKALTINIDTNWERALVSYKCPWCEYFHHKRAKTSTELKRADKAYRRWIGEL